MNTTTPLFAGLCLLAASATAQASLLTWQTEVGTGTTPAATVFTTTTGASPALVNVGSLSGDRSFEFIYFSTGAAVSQALMGSQAVASGSQGLKAEQFNNTGLMGMTDFGVADYNSTFTAITNADTHVVYTSNGVDTLMYVNGALVFTYSGVDLTMTGTNALAAASNSAGSAFFDNLSGSVLGFASYDSALSPAEVATHYNAFAVPEPGVSALALLAGLGLVRRRR